MPQLRYKTHPDEPFAATGFNMHAMAEVNTGDDSVSIRDLDVFIRALDTWMDMGEAFRLRLLITDNYNRYFFEPKTTEDKERGFTL